MARYPSDFVGYGVYAAAVGASIATEAIDAKDALVGTIIR